MDVVLKYLKEYYGKQKASGYSLPHKSVSSSGTPSLTNDSDVDMFQKVLHLCFFQAMLTLGQQG